MNVMSNPDNQKIALKQKLALEFKEYWLNVIYLMFVFAAFTQYRRLLLASYDISYTNWGFAVIESLILAKVIMIGSVLRIGRGLEKMPLIIPTVYKTVLFTLFVGLFTVVESVVKAVVEGDGPMAGIHLFFGKGHAEILANSLMLFAALMPFFAIKELERVLGPAKIRALFFTRRSQLPPSSEM
jgi:hypothetical protein